MALLPLANHFAKVYATATNDEHHIFATSAWMTIPFSIHPKTTADGLFDLLLQLPTLLGPYEHPQSLWDILDLEIIAESLLSRLECWWVQYSEEKNHILQAQRDVLVNIPRDSVTTNEVFPRAFQELEHPDPFTGSIESSHHAARMIINSILANTSDQPLENHFQVATYTDKILSYASSQLTSGVITDKTFAAMMVFPLHVVCRWSMDQQQTQAAKDMLLQWGKLNGLEGICYQWKPHWLLS
jgi:hypothetical protein